jgi:hypothetical protein
MMQCIVLDAMGVVFRAADDVALLWCLSNNVDRWFRTLRKIFKIEKLLADASSVVKWEIGILIV